MVPMHVFVQSVPDHYPMLDLMLRSLARCPEGMVMSVNTVAELGDPAPPAYPGKAIHRSWTRTKGFAPHGDWIRSTVPDATMLAIAGRGIGGDDWMLRTDCDVVFLNAKVLEAALALHTDIGIAGCAHYMPDRPPHRTHFGEFRWMSGSCMLIRGRYLHALDVVLAGDPQLTEFRRKMEAEQDPLPKVCDVAVSYIVQSLGARAQPLDKDLCACDNVAGALTDSCAEHTADRYSLVHYGETMLGGERVAKVDVPAKLAAMGLDRWR